MITETKPRRRILFGQLASNGDCILVTPLVKQLKEEDPTCHITWAIGSAYTKTIAHNPYIDAIWEIPLTRQEDIVPMWATFETMAYERLKKNDFDEIVIPGYAPMNYDKYYLTTRSSIFRSFGRKITVPISPILFLTDAERENVKQFVEENKITDYKHVILFESSPKTGQAKVDVEKGLRIAKEILEKQKDVAVILSSNIPVESYDKRLISANILTYRENAELAKYCTLLIGCSSGISWMLTSESTKKLPTIQILSKEWWWASMTMDHNLLGLPDDRIIEMQDTRLDEISMCVDVITSQGFKSARKKYHKPIHLPVRDAAGIFRIMRKQKRYSELKNLIRVCLKQYRKEEWKEILKIIYKKNFR
jgi:hypothetical protein